MTKRPITLLALACALSAAADPHVLYVGPSGNDSNSGLSENEARLTINSALATMEGYADIDDVGGTVYLLDGTYADEVPVDTSSPIGNSAVAISHPIAIESLSGDPTKVTIARTAANGKFRLFHLNHADAAVRHVTVRLGELENGKPGGGFYVDNGSVVDCIVENCKNGGNNQIGAGGIYLLFGRVSRTIVRNCSSTNMRNYGAGIYAAGGVIDNCLITGCTSAHHPRANGNGAVCLMGAAKMVNCSVTKNSSCFVSGVIVGSANASAVNCAVYGNTLCTRENDHDANWTTRFYGCFATSDVGQTGRAPLENAAMTSAFANCASEHYPAGSVGCVTLVSSPFSDFDNGDYSVANNSSPIANAGSTTLARSLFDSTTDLAGANRYSGTYVDIGAYELQEGFAVSASADKYSLVIPEDNPVTFAVEANGANGAITYTWDFGDGSTLTTNSSTVTHSYLRGGSFTVSLSARDDSGVVTFTIPKRINVSQFTFECTVSAYSVITNEAVTYSIVSLSTNSPIVYTWDFGDGTSLTTTETNITHQYTVFGHYDVSVVGASDTLGSYNVSLANPIAAVPRDIYADPANTNAREPYDSWASAGNKLATLVAYAASGCVIHLKAGTYNNDKGADVTVDKAISIIGEGATPNDVVIPGNSTVNSGQRNMSVTSEGAFVCNLMLYGGFAGSGPGGGNLFLSAGTVSNCVLSSGCTRNFGAESGGAKVTGGLLTHCVITNAYNGNRGAGIALVQTGGRVSNCLITCNKKSWDSTRNSISLVSVSGGVMDNCTIAKCWIMYNTKQGKYQVTDKAVEVSGAGRAYNIAITDIGYVGYSSDLDQVVDYMDAAPQRWAGTAANFVKCVTDDAAPINETCSTGTPNTMFLDYAKGDLTPNTALRNKGGAIDGVAFPSVDLAGNPRLTGSRIDVGCYEGKGAGFFLFLQ